MASPCHGNERIEPQRAPLGAPFTVADEYLEEARMEPLVTPPQVTHDTRMSRIKGRVQSCSVYILRPISLLYRLVQFSLLHKCLMCLMLPRASLPQTFGRNDRL